MYTVILAVGAFLGVQRTRADRRDMVNDTEDLLLFGGHIFEVVIGLIDILLENREEGRSCFSEDIVLGVVVCGL